MENAAMDKALMERVIDKNALAAARAQQGRRIDAMREMLYDPAGPYSGFDKAKLDAIAQQREAAILAEVAGRDIINPGIVTEIEQRVRANLPDAASAEAQAAAEHPIHTYVERAVQDNAAVAQLRADLANVSQIRADLARTMTTLQGEHADIKQQLNAMQQQHRANIETLGAEAKRARDKAAADIQALAATNAQQLTRIGMLQAAADAASAEVTGLKQKRTELEAALVARQADIAQLRSIEADLRANIAQSTGTAASAAATLKQSQEALASAQQAMAQLQQKYDTAVRDLQSKTAREAQLTQELAAARATNDETRKQLADQKQAYEAQLTALKASHETQVNKLREDVNAELQKQATLAQQIAEQRQRIADMEATKAAAETNLTTMQNAESALRTNVKTLEDANARLNGEITAKIDEVNKHVANAQAAAEKINMLTQRLSTVDAKLKTATKNLAASEARIAELEKAAHVVRDEQKRAVDEKSSLESTLSARNADYEQKQATALQKITELTSSKASIEAELATERANANAMRVAINTLGNDNTQFKSALAAANAAAANETASRQEALEQVASLKQKIDALQQELDAAKKDLATSVVHIRELEEKVRGMQASQKTLDEEKKKLEEIIRERDSKIAALEASLAQLTASDAQKSAAAKQKAESFAHQLDELTTAKTALTGQLAASEAEYKKQLGELKATNETLRREVADLNTKGAQAAQRVLELQQQLASSQESLKARIADIAERDAQISTLQQQLASTAQELQKKAAEFTALHTYAKQILTTTNKHLVNYTYALKAIAQEQQLHEKYHSQEAEKGKAIADALKRLSEHVVASTQQQQPPVKPMPQQQQPPVKPMPQQQQPPVKPPPSGAPGFGSALMSLLVPGVMVGAGEDAEFVLLDKQIKNNVADINHLLAAIATGSLPVQDTSLNNIQSTIAQIQLNIDATLKRNFDAHAMCEDNIAKMKAEQARVQQISTEKDQKYETHIARITRELAEATNTINAAKAKAEAEAKAAADARAAKEKAEKDAAAQLKAAQDAAAACVAAKVAAAKAQAAKVIDPVEQLAFFNKMFRMYRLLRKVETKLHDLSTEEPSAAIASTFSALEYSLVAATTADQAAREYEMMRQYAAKNATPKGAIDAYPHVAAIYRALEYINKSALTPPQEVLQGRTQDLKESELSAYKQFLRKLIHLFTRHDLVDAKAYDDVDIKKIDPEAVEYARETKLKELLEAALGAVKVFVKLKITSNPEENPVFVRIATRNNAKRLILTVGKDGNDKPIEEVFDAVCFDGLVPGSFDPSKPSMDGASNNDFYERISSTLETTKSGAVATVFAVGSSGSGKTFTVTNDSNSVLLKFAADPSIIQKELYAFEQYGFLDITGNPVDVLSRVRGDYKSYGTGIYNLYTPDGASFNESIFTYSRDASGNIVSQGTPASAFEGIAALIAKKDSHNLIADGKDFVQTIHDIEQIRVREDRIRATMNNPESSRGHVYYVVSLTFKDGVTGYLVIVDMGGQESPRDIFMEYMALSDTEKSDDVKLRFNTYFEFFHGISPALYRTFWGASSVDRQIRNLKSVSINEIVAGMVHLASRINYTDVSDNLKNKPLHEQWFIATFMYPALTFISLKECSVGGSGAFISYINTAAKFINEAVKNGSSLNDAIDTYAMKQSFSGDAKRQEHLNSLNAIGATLENFRQRLQKMYERMKKPPAPQTIRSLFKTFQEGFYINDTLMARTKFFKHLQGFKDDLAQSYKTVYDENYTPFAMLKPNTAAQPYGPTIMGRLMGELNGLVPKKLTKYIEVAAIRGDVGPKASLLYKHVQASCITLRNSAMLSSAQCDVSSKCANRAVAIAHAPQIGKGETYGGAAAKSACACAAIGALGTLFSGPSVCIVGIIIMVIVVLLVVVLCTTQSEQSMPIYADVDIYANDAEDVCYDI